jgi:hypothetical protein
LRAVAGCIDNADHENRKQSETDRKEKTMNLPNQSRPIIRGVSTAKVAAGVNASQSPECTICRIGCNLLPEPAKTACLLACQLVC